jgi:hypothetical protein
MRIFKILVVFVFVCFLLTHTATFFILPKVQEGITSSLSDLRNSNQLSNHSDVLDSLDRQLNMYNEIFKVLICSSLTSAFLCVAYFVTIVIKKKRNRECR